ncbi:hypothetical protein GOM49_12875 [Clostridium bovifaecis]|uniref:CstA N-terminal domain-containing protein n=1 Tax=Clostridium bovifaecis TaxID=2184719 RepID=A0A6I6ETB9_9CLOT|nr:hypothetical protein GOM49_12875 [Clostridium bovifaecis]
MKLVGYGAMLIEGVLAVVAIITASYIGAEIKRVIKTRCC